MKSSVIIFLIISAGLLIYSNSFGNPFIWDDLDFVIRNDLIKDLRFAPFYFTRAGALAPGGLGKENYRPLLPLSYAIDYFFWKLNPFGYHLTNTLFHIANALLLFYLVRAITKRKLAAGFASLFFLAHPVQTESVTWIAGRADVMFLFFYLAALAAYLGYAKKKRLILYFVSLLSFACGLLSKEMAATLPFILILYDFFYGKKEKIAFRLLRYFPYFLVLEAYVILRFYIIGKLAQTGYWTGEIYTTMLTMAKGIMYYVGLLIYPANLCADHLRFPISTSIKEQAVFFSVSAIAILIIATVALAKKFKDISFSILWFFITLLPVSNIIPIRILIAERFLYLPSIGYAIIVALLFQALYDKSREKKALRYSAFSSGVLLLALYSCLTMARNKDWADEVTWYRRIVETYPSNSRARHNLALAYFETGEPEKAYEEVTRAIEINPEFLLPRMQLAGLYVQKGDFEKAIAELKRIRQADPNFLEPHMVLGFIYILQKKYGPAHEEFQKILVRDPDFLEARLHIAELYSAKGDKKEAIKEYEKILKERPPHHYRAHYAAAYLRLGSLYAFAGDTENSARAWGEIYRNFREQVWFYEISRFLTGETALEELRQKTESWQQEFKAVLYYYIGVKKELERDREGALAYYARVADMSGTPFSAVKIFAAERMEEIGN